ncbi:hypothetical protein Pmani_004350 [Petrolisthes manimaculis]|uniref:Nuclear pore complex protein Nup88 n=1 Tax=Petrolisthes manimaculis TaxID=1843537 RepID=A0AAE1UP23_9EUCA|nr:hypothetical protein Pmani_004350 [Petrolisthes manimaculis]
MAAVGCRNLMLSKILSEKCKGKLLPKKCPRYELLCHVDDLVLAWSRGDVCLYTQLQHPPDSIVQQLALSRPPVWDVEQVLLNKSENCVALVGRRGVAIVDLPQRSGTPPLFDKGRETITCRVEYIADRFFSCHPKLEVVEAAWHPGSPDNTHIVILTSDNYFRIYNLLSLEIPEQAVSVGLVQPGVVLSACTGESACTFAFGQPKEALKFDSGNPVSNSVIDNLLDDDEERRLKHRGLQWPVFFLFGNGDVYFITTVLGAFKPQMHTLHGPMAMTPSSIDNYGVDFCGLLVLPSWPPVLVLATTAGHLHHCVVIDDQKNNNPFPLMPQQDGHQFSVPTSVKLYVYESVELELSLLQDDEAFTSSLLLHPDPSNPTRYWVSHEAGIHAVTLPLVENFLQFSEMANDAEFSEQECECVVEHLICTRSLTPAAPMPVTGVVSGAAHTMLVLLASGRIIALSLPSIYNQQLFESGFTNTNMPISPLRKVHSENFEGHIRSILQRSTSQPLLVSGSGSKVTPAEYLNLMNRVMSTLRTNYIQPQRVVRMDIQRRSDILSEQKQRLKIEIEDLLAQKKALTDKAHDLAEKYEEANDKKNQLIERLERVMTQVMRAMPVLSTSEKNMSRELEAMQTHFPAFTNQLAQIKEKDKWQANQMEKFHNSEASKRHQICSVSETQQKALNQALSKESEKLSVLLEKINQAKQDLNL